jgi:hypothetical protein
MRIWSRPNWESCSKYSILMRFLEHGKVSFLILQVWGEFGNLCPLVSAWYTERAVWAQSTAPDGLPLAGEDKQGVERSVRIHTPILVPFAPISFIFCSCFPPRSSATVHRHGRWASSLVVQDDGLPGVTPGFLSQNWMLIVCVPRNQAYTHTV